MPAITAALVKELRDETGLPMMDCKKALEESDGDKEAAKQKLRESGKKLMSIRQDRATEEGRIGVYASVGGKVGAIIELQCESAPVAQNEEFVQLANDLAQQLATGPGAKTPEELWAQPSPSKKGATLEQQRDDLQNKIREVFRLARIERIDAPTGGFVHMAKIGVLVEVEGGGDELAKDVALHVAAMSPKAATKESLAPELVAKEKQIQIERARQEGKPENIIEKMIEGRMRNFYAEHVLEEQPFVRDESQTVGALAKAGGMKVKRFVRWTLGEASASS
ncbi:MAG TPA: translation elongation factor Ts [Lacipirellulaceae bacterium]|nr:translation elongation factor Ts [Lacipirellulaceae bacterium]HMP04972.1 translation elongation factor Ts [Lacipirellulaceae bacterium]